MCYEICFAWIVFLPIAVAVSAVRASKSSVNEFVDGTLSLTVTFLKLSALATVGVGVVFSMLAPVGFFALMVLDKVLLLHINPDSITSYVVLAVYIPWAATQLYCCYLIAVKE